MSAVITRPRVRRLVLIIPASLFLSPAAPDLSTFSDPILVLTTAYILIDQI